MTSLLPGSSEPNAEEIRLMQHQVDRVQAENRILSHNEQDEQACLELIPRIPRSLGEEVTPGPRFSGQALVGIGAFGLVFVCEDGDQKRERVAIKMLRPSRRNDRIARERLQEECRVMSMLHHPNIVKVFGQGEIDQIPYIVTEFADAGSLASLMIDPQHSVSPKQAAWLISRIAHAVDAAHSTPILHRDIKPGNILLRRELPERSEGLARWPLLTDFGLSKSLAAPSSAPLTFDGEVLGTLSYMSPEQVQGQPLKTQSDIFSLGVILHELAYGEHPFRDKRDFQTRSNIVQYEPFKPQGQHRRVPATLDAIISKCLRKKPEDRYLHASDLTQDLENFLSGNPISVSPPSTWQALVRWAYAHPIASTFLGTLLSCIFAALLLLSREWRTEWALAEDRARISQLFLESMRATNSGINEAIVSGRRVLLTELLETLDQQIPLLEDARRLDPDDQRLIRQLEVMYHYQSLCLSNAVFNEKGAERETSRAKAVEARRKSLECIANLLPLSPQDDRLKISEINGLYQMSTLFQHGGDLKECRAWLERADARAEAFLMAHPDNTSVQETRNVIELHLASLATDAPDEALRLLERVGDSSLDLLDKTPTQTSNLVYAIQANFLRGNLLVQLGRVAETEKCYQRLDAILSDVATRYLDDWRVVDAVMEQYVDRCTAFFQAEKFDDMLPLIARFESFIDRFRGTSYAARQEQPKANLDCLSLRALHFRWLAVSRRAPGSGDERQAAEECRKGIERCRSNLDLKPSLLDAYLQSIPLPLGPLGDGIVERR